MRRRLAATLVIVGIAGAIAGGGTLAAFSNAGSNPSNQLTAGTVMVSDSQPAATTLTISNLRPSGVSTNCLAVSFDGSLDGDVRQYMSTGGALVPYLNVRVTRGSGLSAAFPACTGFTADGVDYIGQGAGVVYDGAVSSFPGSAGAATVDPTNGSPETWTTGESHAYRYEFTITNTPAAQGLSADVLINYEGRNL